MSVHVKNLLFALFLALALGACGKSDVNNLQAVEASNTASIAEVSNAEIEQAFKAKKSDVQVSGQGVVIKLLKDDNNGSRHQKFLVKINAQQTLLFAHNIDLAPRVPLQAGDEISFYGEYLYNPKGGVMHWTHHAPRGDHVAGWIMHNGQKYQ
ncbi:MAG TPA: DUF3465 domain-containing protein [Methylotenera sp.]|nr:DUF3465 domain-containing protein [Methylotenera sp.]